MSFHPHYVPVRGAAEPRESLALLHGILASGRNWRTFARRLVEREPAREALLVDLRCHGDSSGAPPPHTVAACAEDLARLFDALDRPPEVVVGHSFGGKVALALAQRRPMRQLWLVDSLPGPEDPAAPEREGHPRAVIRALKNIDLPVPNRQALVDELTAAGYGGTVANWMTTNLEPVEGGLSFRFELDCIEALLADYARLDLWSVLESPPEGVRIGVVVASRGVYGAADRERLAGIREVGVHEVEAGHWVHFERPEVLLELVGSGYDGAE